MSETDDDMDTVERVPEAPDVHERSILIGWLAFHGGALEAKCAGLDPVQLVPGRRRRR